MSLELFFDFVTNVAYPSNVTTVIEVKWSLFLFLIGSFLLFLFKYPTIKKFILISSQKDNETVQEDHTTPYDHISEPNLEKIINKLTNNYRIVVAVYGVLLSFVVSDILITKEPNWSIIIWTGWIIGFTVRIGAISITLSDVLENRKNNESLVSIARYVYGSKNFLKHILIILIPLIALLPATAISSVSTKSIETQIDVFGIAGGIIGIAFFLYLITKIKEFQTVDGPKVLYVLILSFIFIGAISHGASSPLQPVTVLFFDNSVSMPLIFDGFRYVSGIFGALVITIFGKGLLHNLILFVKKLLPKIRSFLKLAFQNTISFWKWAYSNFKSD